MMRNNKILKPFLPILVVSLLVACEKKSTQEIQEKEFENPYNYVGEEHNEIMSYAFDYIKNELEKIPTTESLAQTEITREAVLALGADAVVDFCEENELTKGALFEFEDEIKNGVFFDPQYYLMAQSGVESISQQNNDDVLFKNYLTANPRITKQQRGFLDRLLQILDEEEEYKLAVAQIKSLEKEAATTLNENEFKIVGISTAIAKSSIQYTYQNAEKWADLLLSVRIKSNKNIGVSIEDVTHTDFNKMVEKMACDTGDGYDWGEVGKEDVKGAIVGAIGGALVAGVGAAAGGVTGAGGASVGEMAGQLWDAVSDYGDCAGWW